MRVCRHWGRNVKYALENNQGPPFPAGPGVSLSAQLHITGRHRREMAKPHTTARTLIWWYFRCHYVIGPCPFLFSTKWIWVYLENGWREYSAANVSLCEQRIHLVQHVISRLLWRGGCLGTGRFCTVNRRASQDPHEWQKALTLVPTLSYAQHT